jgi:hypothetical protein
MIPRLDWIGSSIDLRCDRFVIGVADWWDEFLRGGGAATQKLGES